MNPPLYSFFLNKSIRIYLLNDKLTYQLVFERETFLKSDPQYGTLPLTNVFAFLETDPITILESSILIYKSHLLSNAANHNE